MSDSKNINATKLRRPVATPTNPRPSNIDIIDDGKLGYDKSIIVLLLMCILCLLPLIPNSYMSPAIISPK